MTDATSTRNRPTATDDSETTSSSQDTPANGVPESNEADTHEAPDPVASQTPGAAENLFASRVSIPASPEPSPDGRWLAYLLDNQEDGAGMQLWLTPTDGGDPVQIELPFTPVEERDPETDRQLRGPQWAPDGLTIALTGEHPDGGRTAIWLVSVPEAVMGTAITPQAVPATEETPDQPDTSDASDTEGETESASAEASEETATETEGESEQPNPSAESEEAADEPSAENAEVSSEESQAEKIAPAVVELPEGPVAARLLVDHAYADRTPRWSIDGSIVAFVSHMDGRDVIMLAGVAGEDQGVAELLSWSSRNDREPAWSRDGRYLAFTRQRLEGPDHADILVYDLAEQQLRNLTEEKDDAVRHSLEWVPGRNLIAFVTLEGDWLSISVVNADNRAGWTVTRESGDKTEPRFAPSEPRLAYVRTEGFTTVICERGLHASGAVALDPGEGVGRYPRWIADKRLAYGFTASQSPFTFFAQDNTASAERTKLQAAGAVSLVGAGMRNPHPFEYDAGEDEQFSGLMYTTPGVAGPVPGLVYIPDGPLATRRGEFQVEEQAIASTAVAIVAPVIHGASGFGWSLQHDLAEEAGTEIEANDLADAGAALGKRADIDDRKLALIGNGYGGTLALLTAGARPGIYNAVVAIDPIVDWPIEIAGAPVSWRNWIVQQYGLPLSNPDNYALRSPETFAAVIDVPIVLVSTSLAPAHRKEQLALLTAYLDEANVSYEHIEIDDKTLAETLVESSKAVVRHLLEGREEVQVVSDLESSEI